MHFSPLHHSKLGAEEGVKEFIFNKENKIETYLI